MARDVRQVGWTEFSELFPVSGLRGMLADQVARLDPDGWILFRVAVMDSSRFGDKWVTPYGGSATLKELPPDGQWVSVNGLPSGISEPVAVMSRARFEEVLA